LSLSCAALFTHRGADVRRILKDSFSYLDPVFIEIANRLDTGVVNIGRGRKDTSVNAKV